MYVYVCVYRFPPVFEGRTFLWNLFLGEIVWGEEPVTLGHILMTDAQNTPK